MWLAVSQGLLWVIYTEECPFEGNLTADVAPYEFEFDTPVLVNYLMWALLLRKDRRILFGSGDH